MAHDHDNHDHDHEHELEEIVVLEDEEGNEHECAIYDFEFEGRTYAVLFPIDQPEQGGFVYKLDVDEAGEEILVEIEDDQEFERVVAFLESEED
ncbi:MAG: DUF1292 domain-containing protein [Limnochordia bacterium]|jgi:uncharacterized protein YrzB (UPF0473 family)|nr:DUF1292 domain-containing protein [Bacillota bacterium]NLL08740.1 DUF1292 domain-containing protein [Bacillota bacterium]HBG09998.1 DUF1292 domain-containing protein [Bacillota bacterium]